MSVSNVYASYSKLRGGPTWKLLAANNAPAILAILQSNLWSEERSLPASIFFERLERDLAELRLRLVDLPQTAQAYASEWLAAGYIERYFPEGASEEEYELSLAGVGAVRYAVSLIEGRNTATESRLGVVIDQLIKLSEDTDSNPVSRLAALEAERERIDRELELIWSGKFQAISDEIAVERAREVIALADELVSDFRRVRSKFEELNGDLRLKLISGDELRSTVLADLFDGVDLISESEAGRSFASFWRMLTDLERSTSFEDALDSLSSRSFWMGLTRKERTFLLKLTSALLGQGGVVHDVMQRFARSLKQFVQSREFLEQRRLSELLKEAQGTALHLKDAVRASDSLDYVLTLSSTRVGSISQHKLHDPSTLALDGKVMQASQSEITLADINDLVSQSEINFAELKRNIKNVVAKKSPVNIAEILAFFPASQGLGSVVGLLSLGCQYGTITGDKQRVEWSGGDDKVRAAFVPVIYFSRQSIKGMPR